MRQIPECIVFKLFLSDLCRSAFNSILNEYGMRIVHNKPHLGLLQKKIIVKIRGFEYPHFQEFNDDLIHYTKCFCDILPVDLDLIKKRLQIFAHKETQYLDSMFGPHWKKTKELQKSCEDYGIKLPKMNVRSIHVNGEDKWIAALPFDECRVRIGIYDQEDSAKEACVQVSKEIQNDDNLSKFIEQSSISLEYQTQKDRAIVQEAVACEEVTSKRRKTGSYISSAGEHYQMAETTSTQSTLPEKTSRRGRKKSTRKNRRQNDPQDPKKSRPRGTTKEGVPRKLNRRQEMMLLRLRCSHVDGKGLLVRSSHYIPNGSEVIQGYAKDGRILCVETQTLMSAYSFAEFCGSRMKRPYETIYVQDLGMSLAEHQRSCQEQSQLLLAHLENTASTKLEKTEQLKNFRKG